MYKLVSIALLLVNLSAAESPVLACDFKPDLELRLQADRESYELSSEIELEVRLTNSGTSPVTVFAHLLWGRMGGMMLHIRDENGLPVHGRFLDHDMVAPAWLADSAHYVRLNPRHFLGVSRVDRVSDLVEKPGRYEIYVQYLSPVPGKFAPTPGFWSREQGELGSAPITIEVVATAQ